MMSWVSPYPVQRGIFLCAHDPERGEECRDEKYTSGGKWIVFGETVYCKCPSELANGFHVVTKNLCFPLKSVTM